jgi:hypothetical protein
LNPLDIVTIKGTQTNDSLNINLISSSNPLLIENNPTTSLAVKGTLLNDSLNVNILGTMGPLSVTVDNPLLTPANVTGTITHNG